MKKIIDLEKLNIKLICWDLDGTLFDTETMWFNMDKLITEKYGKELSKDEYNNASEKIAADAYNNWGYRANADKALKSIKNKGIYQVVVNKCSLTNKSMLKNTNVNNTFSFNNFDEIISEETFESDITLKDMYEYALEKYKISDNELAVAICDMPFELKEAKDSGFTTIWAKNKNYPFTKAELKEIKNFADYYVEDFLDLIK